MKADVANPFDLTGRVAVVTDFGSSTGIGTATASLLADLRAAQRVVDAAVHRWGRLDLLVGNIGTTSVSGPAGPGDRVQVVAEERA
jgi:NAD(P)-dependent dehydrogenase (short-subunit alcohol dehydrogenase family)